MSVLSKQLCAVVLVLGVGASACQSTAIVAPTLAEAPPADSTLAQPSLGSEPTPTPTSAPAQGPESTPAPQPAALLTADLLTAIDNLARAYEGAADAWAGYVPGEHPVVLALKDDAGVLTGALAINHQAPGRIGESLALDTSGTPFSSLDLIANVRAEEAAFLQGVGSFQFSRVVGGVDSFVMVAGGEDEFFDPLSDLYASTLLHEMFHRYQAQTFQGEFVDQDIDGYDYSPANLRLIGLEDRALAAAIQADTRQDRQLAARHLVAIRQTRVERDPRSELDRLQEMREGTARFVEHQLGDTSSDNVYHRENFVLALIDDIPISNVKGDVAFGRWYASGAGMLHLLHLLDVDNVEADIEAGETPVDLLAQAVQADAGDRERLVAEAQSTYDPTNELAEQAEQAAEAVLSEPGFWDQEPADAQRDNEGANNGQFNVTPELLACLQGEGVDTSNNRMDVTQEQMEKCLPQG